MLKLLWKLAVFGLLIGLSMQTLFVVARSFETEYYEDGTYEWVNRLPIRPKIFLMGSSTVYNNLNPIEIGSKLGLQPGEVIDFGWITHSPIHMYHYWNTLDRGKDSVRVVLMSVDPWIAYQSYDWILQFPTLYWTPLQRLYTAIDPSYPHFVLSGMIVTDVFKKVARKATGHLPPELRVPETYGSEILTHHMKNFKEETREYFGNTTIYPISELYLSRLAELKRSVEAHGAKFVLFLPPKKRVWRDGYERDCRAIDSEFVARLNSSLGPTRVIGRFAQFSEASEDTLFVDHVHLTGEGQRRLSDSIAALLPKVLASQPKYLNSLLRN